MRPERNYHASGSLINPKNTRNMAQKRIYAMSYWNHLFTVKTTGPLSNIAMLFLGAFGTSFNEGTEVYFRSKIGKKLVDKYMLNHEVRKRIDERVKAANGFNISNWYWDNQTV